MTHRVDQGLPPAKPNAGPGAELRAGVLLSVRVQEDLGQGLYRVEAGPRSLVAKSETPLQVGQVLSALVSAPGPGEADEASLVLRILESRQSLESQGPGGLDPILRQAQVPLDPAGRFAAAALLAAGQKARPEALAQLRKAVLGAAGLRQESQDLQAAAETGAALEAKGFRVEADLIAALMGGGGPSYHGSPSGGRDQGRQEGEPNPGLEPGREVLRVLEPETLVPELASFLRGLCLASREAPSGDPDSLGAVRLGLFNHARAEGQNWVQVPFAFSLDSIAFAGYFRILLPYIAGGPGRLCARFSASSEGAEASGESQWALDLSFGVGAPQAQIARQGRPPAPGQDRGTLAQALASELEGLGWTVKASQEAWDDGSRFAGRISINA